MVKRITKRTIQRYAQKAYDLMAEIPRDEYGNPLTFEGAIKSAMLKSPDRLPYRDDVLNLLFCEIGTGVVWSDKRLVEVFPDNYMNMPTQVRGQICWLKDLGIDDEIERKLEEIKKYLPEFESELVEERKKEFTGMFEVIDSIDERCKTYRGRTSWGYVEEEASCLLCAPTDAQEDFKQGAIETINLILKTEPGSKAKAMDIKELKHKKKIAKRILSTLTKG